MTDAFDNPHADDFYVSADKRRLDRAWVEQALLAQYWGARLTPELIERAIENSICFGLYHHFVTGNIVVPIPDRQVGFARVVSDGVCFSWLCDVVIDRAYRKQGLGRFLVLTAISAPEIRDTTVNLGTRDAHEFYGKLGFVRCEQMKRDALTR